MNCGWKGRSSRRERVAFWGCKGNEVGEERQDLTAQVRKFVVRIFIVMGTSREERWLRRRFQRCGRCVVEMAESRSRLCVVGGYSAGV